MDNIFVLYFFHKNIQFTFEKETNNELSFLNIEITRDKIQLIPIQFSRVFSNFDSFIPKDYKFSLVSTLLPCCYSTCCSVKLFYKEIMQLKKIFENNSYGNKFFNRCLRIFLRILTGKKHPKIKLQHLRKIRIWTFGSLVHQINSF